MSAFNQMLNKVRDRNWGGTASTVACEPYISGYSYIKWQLPAMLQNYINKGYLLTSSGLNPNDQTWTETTVANSSSTLDAAMTSITPPGGTINKITYNTLGGGKWSVPGAMDYGDSLSVRYIEFSGLPILRIHRSWVNMIRDNKVGLTGLTGGGRGGQGTYNKSDYSATLLYWTTKPDGVTVEYAAAYSGVFPVKDPLDSFTGDITAIDKLEIDIDYNVDMIWHEDWVYQMAQVEADSKAYGAVGSTRWSREGGRFANQVSTKPTPKRVTDTPSTL